MGMNFGDIIQLATGGDVEIGVAVLGAFLCVFSILQGFWVDRRQGELVVGKAGQWWLG